MTSWAEAGFQITANFFGKLVFQRHLIWNFVVRDLRMRYVGSLMGFFWAVVHPLVLLISYTFVFSLVFRIRPQTTATDNFAVFLFAGILPWLYFQDSLMRSCNSVVEHAHLIRKTVFPSEILPVVTVLSNLVFHLVGLGILLLVLAWMNLLGVTVLLVPLYLLPLLVLALGLGWLVAALQVFLRDTSQVLSVVLVFWFWFTPIFYTVDMVPAAFQPLVSWNPLTAVVAGYRACLLEGQGMVWGAWVWLWAAALACFVFGGWVFRNTKREFLDVL